ncbi:MAG: protein translocase subunit SecF [Nitrospinae bacterium]|nr:protein translocase subunit SecF [Nitrospinota bacterium]
MELFKPDSKIDFMSQRRLAIGVSIAMVVISLLALAIKGPNYGVDFKGGTLIQVKFTEKTTTNDVRDVISALNLGDFSIQEFGSPDELLIRIPIELEQTPGKETMAQKVEAALKAKYTGKFAIQRMEMVGPKVGADLQWKALLSVFYSLIGILIYLAFRFEFRYAAGAVLATMHDPLIILGVFSLLGKEFTLTVLASILTVIGYSLNDTIVVFDRIRENMKLKRGMPTLDMLNLSINQTLSRTILTSSTVFMVVVALYFFGGEVIHDFALALIIGVVVGTYSSIYVASPIIHYWEVVAKKRQEAARASLKSAEKAVKKKS